jgi:hypothetical protein
MQFGAEERTLLERCTGKPMAQEAFANLDELTKRAVDIVLDALDSLMTECEENTNMTYKDEYVIEEIKKKTAAHGASSETDEELDAWMERHSVNGAHRLAWARAVCVPTNRKGEMTEEVREAARMLVAEKMAEENPLVAAMWDTIYGPGLEDHQTFAAGCVLSGALDYMCDKNVDYVMSTLGGGTSLWRMFSDAEIVRCAILMADSWDEDACARPEDADEVEGYCVVLARWLKETLGNRFDELRVTEEELGRLDVMALRDDLERWSTECV